MLDIHCHTAGIGAGGSGCFVSKAMEHSYKFGIYLKAFGVSRDELTREGDALILRRISERLAASEHVGAAVILALDGVVDEHGGLDRTRTEVYVPNEFVANETARYTNLFFGASVNPFRTNALEQLVWAKAHGAKLVKWIPGVMQIDPADERITPFYRKLVELNLPLLTHAGRERSFTKAQELLNDPQRLQLPLGLGVKVIVAHIASSGTHDCEADTDRLARMMVVNTNLYADISALTLVHKVTDLRVAISRPEFRGRLLYGTDYPLINTLLFSPYYLPRRLTLRQMKAIGSIKNPWDRDVALKQALGVPNEVFTKANAILR